jgi:type IV pilus modification protein PilV
MNPTRREPHHAHRAGAVTAQRAQAGFTIIEALVALMILTFGLLAVSGMQLTLSSNGDISKQRTEAIRLAQEKIEYLRSYSQVTSATLSTTLAYANLASGSDSITTNAVFSRSWSVSGTATATLKPILLTMSWADRTGTTQTLTVSSVISQSNPYDSGLLAFPVPESSTLRRFANRSLDIPFLPKSTIVNLTGSNAGKSAYALSSTFSIIFDNYNGSVVKTCSSAIQSASADLSLCTTTTGVVLAGFIRFGTCSDASCTTRTDITHTGVTLTGITGNSAAVQCTTTLASNFKASTSTVSVGGVAAGGLSTYICLIPLADSNSYWYGNVVINGVPKTANDIVCRYQYIDSALTANQRNVQPYTQVSDSIDNQNYYIGTSTTTGSTNTTATCPSIAQSDPTLSTAGAAAQAATVNLTLHQNCRSTVDTLSTRATSISSSDTPPTTYCP